MQKIIDFHTHIGKDRDGTQQTIQNLLDSMQQAEVNHSVIFPLHDKEKTVEQASLDLLEKIQDYPFYPFFRFNPKTITLESLKQNLDKFYGVKLHPRAQDFDPLDEKYAEIYQVIAEAEKPLLIHSKVEEFPHSHPEKIMELAKLFPDLDIVLGHFGHYLLHIIKQIKNLPNVYLETSIMVSSPRSIEKVANDYLGADKMIFGSDIPYSDQEFEKMKIERTILSKLDKEKILYYNAAKLLKVG